MRDDFYMQAARTQNRLTDAMYEAAADLRYVAFLRRPDELRSTLRRIEDLHRWYDAAGAAYEARRHATTTTEETT